MLEKNLFITQNSYYFVHKHFLKFFESKNSEVIFVSEKKRGIKKKYLEIIKNFGIRNFIKIIFYELIYSIILRKRKKSINAFMVSDQDLNQFLEDLISKNKYNLIISIGCPCLIKTNFENYKKPIYNIHGGIIPFQKGRFSPLKSLQKDNKYLGSTIHIIDNYFDAGKFSDGF